MVSGVWSCYAEGWRRVRRHFRVVWLFYVPGLVLAYFASMPLGKALQRSIGHSLASDRVAAELSLRFLGDLAYEHAGLFPTLFALAATGAAIYLLTVTFLLGGAVRSLLLPEPRPVFEVLSDGARFFGCFLRLFLISLPAYAAAIGVGFLVGKGLVALFSLSASPGAWVCARVLAVLGILSGLWFVNLVFDYAKLLAVRHEEHRARGALREAVGFLFSGRFWRAAGLYGLVLLTGALALGMYNLGAAVLDGPAPARIALLIVWQQLFILIRVVVKLLFYGAQASLMGWAEPRMEPVEPAGFLA